MTKEKYNFLGQIISEEEQYVPRKEEYFDESGNPKWKEWLINSDEDGFDISKEIERGKYKIRITLPANKKVVRYGVPQGNFTADEGTDFDGLSLPYKKESLEYHEYIVTQDIDVECIVMKGFAAPGFESNGGAIQYKHNEQIIRLIRKGILVEDFVWLSRMKKN
jgi:hypothetical protein